MVLTVMLTMVVTTVEATEADYGLTVLTVVLCNVACMTVVMVVDCCSITRDSDFTILGEPRRDLNTW